MHYLIEFKNQFYSRVTDSTTRMLQRGKKKLHLKKKNCAVLEKDLAKSCIKVSKMYKIYCTFIVEAVENPLYSLKRNQKCCIKI